MAREEQVVKAFRIMVNLSDKPYGPELSEVEPAIEGLELPVGWAYAILKGWQSYYKRYNKPKDKVLIKKTPARFLSIRMLSRIRLDGSKSTCKLCGLATQKPARSWHKACWKAFEPETSGGWKDICETVYKRDKYTCQTCEKNVLDFSAARRYNRRPYNVDHKLALCLGGTHKVDNLQLLCIDCHKVKTKDDVGRLAALRKEAKLNRE